MNTQILEVAQRSTEWHRARLGRLTGSRAGDMLATLKRGGESAARRDLRLALAVERITGYPAESGYTSPEMQRGIDKEGTALGAYEAATGQICTRVGFVVHLEMMAGCSPDAVADEGGLVEIKCPKSTTHFSYLQRGPMALPLEYIGQLTHNVWITGAPWIDFVSFDDRFPYPLQLLIIRFRREQMDLGAYELAARLFLSEVEKETQAVGDVLERAGV